jgi:hypothetical protein
MAGHGWRDAQSPVGEKAPGRNPTDRGTRGTKRRLLTDGHGSPVAVAGANRHDMKLVEATLHALGGAACAHGGGAPAQVRGERV